MDYDPVLADIVLLNPPPRDRRSRDAVPVS
jgi:hypothetical protein